MSPAELVAELAEAYREHADAEAAEAMSAYMRGQFPFIGIQAKQRRAIDRAVTAKAPSRPTHHYLVKVARDCWGRREREYQYFAVDYLRRHHRRLDPPFLEISRELVVTKSWWDTVDALAGGVIGPFVRAHGMVEAMDSWVTADNLWVVRTALLFQLAAKEDTDVERLFTYCLQRANDGDIFIRKAIGWALRQHARTDPYAVKRFVAAHADTLSPLSIREAMKHLTGEA
ncbi:DNA alkylation repair protein [Euzebya sp.]|uniref:DNA alkylation repair protein n=1 Tax=Euzebya sp. TaxID=1971409 RepID=UPI0035151C22